MPPPEEEPPEGVPAPGEDEPLGSEGDELPPPPELGEGTEAVEPLPPPVLGLGVPALPVEPLEPVEPDDPLGELGEPALPESLSQPATASAAATTIAVSERLRAVIASYSISSSTRSRWALRLPR